MDYCLRLQAHGLKVIFEPDATIVHDAGRPGDVLRLYADMSQAKSLLGYETTVTLADGLARLLAWYRAQPVSPEQLLEHEVVRNWEARA